VDEGFIRQLQTGYPTEKSGGIESYRDMAGTGCWPGAMNHWSGCYLFGGISWEIRFINYLLQRLLNLPIDER
jgi:hypothetical protein